jgi:hypothetical protein
VTEVVQSKVMARSGPTAGHGGLAAQALDTARLHLEPLTVEAARAIVAGEASTLSPAEGWPQPDTAVSAALVLRHGRPCAWLVRRNGRVIGGCGTHGPIDAAGPYT